MSFRSELAVACRLAMEAGTAVRSYQAGTIEIGSKDGGEIVTPADLEADRIIIAGLRAAFPDDALFTEESPDSAERLTMKRVWIVDPIDSTSDFTKGGDEYCVSIGFAVNGHAVVGAVYNPGRDELIAGEVNIGATYNGRDVRVSETTELATARITVSRKEWSRGVTTLGLSAVELVPLSSMAYKLARVAAGLDDGTVSLKSRKEWGTCAGVALVTAAGGRACLLDGQEILFNRMERHQELGMVAAGPGLVGRLCEAAATAATP